MSRLQSGFGPIVVALVMLASSIASAGETRWWVVDSATDFLPGEGDGVAVEADGTLRAVDRWRAAVTFEEPVVLAADRLPGGDLVVATGHPARLYRVRGETLEHLADLPGEQATAVKVDAEGSVWATTVAPGVLVRWRQGKVEEMGRLGEGGLWSLAEFSGEIVVGAGPPAALYRVGERGLERWLEVPDDFVRALAPVGDRLVVGTSGKGLVLSVDSRGRAVLLTDSPFTEISALAVDAGGELWATALVGEPVAQSKKNGSNATSDAENGSESATGTLELDLPKIAGKTATSELVRITPEGALLHVHRFPKQVATALAVDGEAVLVGTGYEGEVWRFVPGGGARVASIDAIQVTAFSADGRALLTQGPAAVFERAADGDRPGRFRGPAESFPRPVRFGRYRIVPDDSGAEIRFRTGGVSDKNKLWLQWTESKSEARGPVDIPHGRALQWELSLPAGARVDRVEVAWREINLPPVAESVTVEDPGVIYLSAPPPSGPVIRRDHPTFQGVFTTIGDNGRKSSQAKKGKKYYQVGYRTVNWEVKDPNGDPLLFDLDIERSDGVLWPIEREFSGSQLAVDVSAAADGRYRFRLSASDEQANASGGETTEALSPWFVVDNTPPRVDVGRRGDTREIVVRDASPLSRVEASWDTKKWHGLVPLDGLLDGEEERFALPEGIEGRPVVVRVFDRHNNRTIMAVEEDS